MAVGKSTDTGLIQARLTRAADSVAAALEVWEDEVETRDRIILEALDAGVPRAEVARLAGISGARVTQIVARRGAEWSG